MNQKKQVPTETQPVSPQEFAPSSQEKKSDIIEQINAALKKKKKKRKKHAKPRYWSCKYGAAKKQHCGCEDGTNGHWGAGGTPSKPIYFSTEHSHWASPVEVDESGNPL